MTAYGTAEHERDRHQVAAAVQTAEDAPGVWRATINMGHWWRDAVGVSSEGALKHLALRLAREVEIQALPRCDRGGLAPRSD
jgi:hypothetical protein